MNINIQGSVFHGRESQTSKANFGQVLVKLELKAPSETVPVLLSQGVKICEDFVIPRPIYGLAAASALPNIRYFLAFTAGQINDMIFY